MAELPGWDRARLAVAHPADVAAARLIVYVRQFAELLGRDFRAELAEVDEAAITDPAAIKRRDFARRGRLKEALTQAWRLQVDIRRRLGMGPIEDQAGA